MDRERDTPSSYPAPVRREFERIVRAGGRPDCPDCRTPMDERLVPPRPDVSYVRDRVWLTCSSCGRSIVIDRVGPSRPDTGSV